MRDHHMGDTTPEGEIHKEQHEKRKPVANDNPVGAKERPDPLGRLKMHFLSRHKIVYQLLDQQQANRGNYDHHVERIGGVLAQLAEENTQGKKKEKERERDGIFKADPEDD